MGNCLAASEPFPCRVGEIMKREKQVSLAASCNSSGLNRAWSISVERSRCSTCTSRSLSSFGGATAKFGNGAISRTALSAPSPLRSF